VTKAIKGDVQARVHIGRIVCRRADYMDRITAMLIILTSVALVILGQKEKQGGREFLLTK